MNSVISFWGFKRVRAAFLLLTFAALGWMPTSVLAQSDYPYPNRMPQEVPRDVPNHGGDRNSGSPFDLGTILLLINTLSRSGGSTPDQVDLKPEIAEIRGNIARLQLLLANQYLLQNQLIEACDAIEKSYVSEMERYLQKRLPPSSEPGSSDCHGSELQRISQITGSRTALIFPVILRDRIEILGIPPAGNRKVGSSKIKQQQPSDQPFRRTTYNISDSTVNAIIQKFHSDFRDAGSNDYLPGAQKLYDLIVRPIEPELEAAQIKTLVFVMPGGLRVVPTAAFHDGKQFLVEKYASVTVTAMPLTKMEPRDRSVNLQILAMGLSEAVQGFSALPSTEVEVGVISSQILKGNAFMNRDFTVDNLQSQRRDRTYNIIHLATHAEFDADKASDAFIQFWNERLRIDKIPSLKLDQPIVEMLVLSACRTAVGANLGISGVAWQSGVKTVMASLWSVSDVGTAPLMIGFYSGLQNASSKAIALQQVQLALLHKKIRIEKGKIKGVTGLADIPLSSTGEVIDLSHPFYWSPFILVGNWL
jgi:CHAT domain-containing protein